MAFPGRSCIGALRKASHCGARAIPTTCVGAKAKRRAEVRPASSCRPWRDRGLARAPGVADVDAHFAPRGDLGRIVARRGRELAGEADPRRAELVVERLRHRRTVEE